MFGWLCEALVSGLMVRDGATAPPHHEEENPHPEERPLGRVSRDEASSFTPFWAIHVRITAKLGSA